MKNSVSIESTDEKHLAFVQKYASNPQISKTSNIPYPYPNKGAEEWYSFIKKKIDAGKGKVFAILNDMEFCAIVIRSTYENLSIHNFYSGGLKTI